MARHTGLCLSLLLGSTILAACTTTTMPVLYGEQPGPNGQRQLMPLAIPAAPTANLVSVLPEAVPFLSPTPVRMVASGQGMIEIRNEGIAPASGTAALVGSDLFASLSPAMQALLFPSCSAERIPTFVAASR